MAKILKFPSNKEKIPRTKTKKKNIGERVNVHFINRDKSIENIEKNIKNFEEEESKIIEKIIENGIAWYKSRNVSYKQQTNGEFKSEYDSLPDDLKKQIDTIRRNMFIKAKGIDEFSNYVRDDLLKSKVKISDGYTLKAIKILLRDYSSIVYEHLNKKTKPNNNIHYIKKKKKLESTKIKKDDEGENNNVYYLKEKEKSKKNIKDFRQKTKIIVKKIIDSSISRYTSRFDGNYNDLKKQVDIICKDMMIEAKGIEEFSNYISDDLYIPEIEISEEYTLDAIKLLLDYYEGKIYKYLESKR
ncbi:hypothetical protein CSB08_00010 [Candidatus Gracilibacteria bacterium]|nr:MAG: hypothetical protein CSB08_00010 [Candidatus Gracilibacteria bacterium]PIE85709.1 MAG: hypothetical protein CSA08_00730 [Candidatus Gracilibacteria bacterium]